MHAGHPIRVTADQHKVSFRHTGHLLVPWKTTTLPLVVLPRLGELLHQLFLVRLCLATGLLLSQLCPVAAGSRPCWQGEALQRE